MIGFNRRFSDSASYYSLVITKNTMKLLVLSLGILREGKI
jgi:hypothetical protein